MTIIDRDMLWRQFGAAIFQTALKTAWRGVAPKRLLLMRCQRAW